MMTDHNNIMTDLAIWQELLNLYHRELKKAVGRDDHVSIEYFSAQITRIERMIGRLS